MFSTGRDQLALRTGRASLHVCPEFADIADHLHGIARVGKMIEEAAAVRQRVPGLSQLF